MREHRVLPAGQHRHGVVPHGSLAVGREPVADHFHRGALGHVRGRRGHITRPCMVDPDLPARHVGVIVVVVVDVDEPVESKQLPGRRLYLRRVARVEVVVSHFHESQRQRLAVVVEDRHLALVLGLPRHGPRVGHRVRVLVHVVLPPRDAGRVDRVRHRVAPLLVVEGVLELAPRLGDVRNVAVVEGTEQVGLHQLADHVDRRHEHVEIDLAAADLRDRLAHRVEGRQLDLALVLLLEVVDALLVDVADPVVDLQGGPPLGLEPAGDPAVGHRPRDGVVGPGQRERRAGRGTGTCRSEKRTEPAHRQSGPGRDAQELPPRHPVRPPGPVTGPPLTRVKRHPHHLPSPFLTEQSIR